MTPKQSQIVMAIAMFVWAMGVASGLGYVLAASQWRQDLIKRGLMQHNAKTGLVEWIDKAKE